MNTAIPLTQAHNLQQQHDFYDLLRHFISKSCCMRAHQVLLQLTQLVIVNTHITQATESGIDTIIGLPAGNLLIQESSVGIYLLKGFFRKGDGIGQVLRNIFDLQMLRKCSHQVFFLRKDNRKNQMTM
ncbi:hypothetical protein D3C72_877400 [compost metagenome]